MSRRSQARQCLCPSHRAFVSVFILFYFILFYCAGRLLSFHENHRHTRVKKMPRFLFFTCFYYFVFVLSGPHQELLRRSHPADRVLPQQPRLVGHGAVVDWGRPRSIPVNTGTRSIGLAAYPGGYPPVAQRCSRVPFRRVFSFLSGRFRRFRRLDLVDNVTVQMRVGARWSRCPQEERCWFRVPSAVGVTYVLPRCWCACTIARPCKEPLELI